MRNSVILFLIILLASCGKERSISSAPGPRGCAEEGRTTLCDNIETNEERGVDLLESMVDVPVSVTSSEITFLSGKFSETSGSRISCRLAVNAGEVYRYSLSGNSLTLMTDEGNFTFNRRSPGDGITGVWTWKGYVGEGIYTIRTLSILNENRVVLRKSCEY